MNKFLYCIAIFSVVAFVNIEVNADTPLQELFSDGAKTVNFSNSLVNYYDTPLAEEAIPTLTQLDSSYYLHNNNTFYINTNTIPLLSNTGRGK